MFSRKGQIIEIPGSVASIQLCHYRARAAIGNISMECLCFNKAVFTKTRGGLDLAQVTYFAVPCFRIELFV